MYRHRLKRSAFVMIVMICALSIISFAKYYPFASLKASQDTFTITNETDVLQIVSSKVEKRDLV
ncbi:MAG TPA: hypothetical protein VJ302_00900, partial [Blastocatellia bacterium]|nr:hypothetical protein [Blastocatellia bacterium]